MTRGIDNIKKARGESTTSIGSLRMKAVQETSKAGDATHPGELKIKLVYG